MSDYHDLRAAALSPAPTVSVSPLDLQELLHEFDLLRAGGKKPTKGAYTPEFEEAWAQYPARPGNSKAAAFKAWLARVKAGASPAEMIAGTIKYAAYCKHHRTEPQYVKQAATFYGPGEHFAADWSIPRALEPRRQLADRRQEADDQKAAASAVAKARLLGHRPSPPDDDMTFDMEKP